MNRPLIPLLGLLYVAGSAALWAQPPRVIQSPVGDFALSLVVTATETRLEDRDGLRAALPVPPGARLSAIAELADGWIAAGEKNTGELALLRGAAGKSDELAGPGDRFGFRRQPIPLVSGGRLAGLVWLEGDGGENNGVYAAGWTAGGWEPRIDVAPWEGAGQLGLAAAALDDGSWLVVWNVDVGGDSEVFWSRVVENEASLPAAVHAENSVPDVLPAVAAVSGGALVAWSRLDGNDYRLRMAAFADRWRDLGFVTSQSSGSPAVFPSAAGAGFVFAQGNPLAWSIIEVEPEGRIARMALVEGRQVRPLVLSVDREGVTVRVPTDETPLGPSQGPVDRLVEWSERP